MRILFNILELLLLMVIVLLLASSQGLVPLRQWVDDGASRLGLVLPVATPLAVDTVPVAIEPLAADPGPVVDVVAVDTSTVAVIDSADAGEPALVPAEGALDPGREGNSEAPQAEEVVGATDSLAALSSEPEPLGEDELAGMELRRMLEERLAGRHQFPEHVKFRNTQFRVSQLYRDAGLAVDMSEEVVFASYCGEYAVPNAAALYGAYYRFYAEVLVNHDDRSMDGETWVEMDGDIKKSISFGSGFLISGRKDDFEARFDSLCREQEPQLWGDYQLYETGKTASFYRKNYPALAARAGEAGLAEELRACLKTAPLPATCLNK